MSNFLRNLFKGGPKTKPKYEPHWELYLQDYDGWLSSVVLDMGVLDIAPVKKFPFLLTVEIPLLEPAENGLQNNEESYLLEMIEQEFINSALADFIYVGRITRCGIRSLYFYCDKEKDSTEIEIARVINKYKPYTYTFSTREDKGWLHFFESMYPDDINFQIMSNNSVLQNLIKNGDDLSQPRDVIHFIVFQELDHKDAFLKEALPLGYQIYVDRNEPGKNSEYYLGIHREEMVSREFIHDNVQTLVDLANACNGEYDGWEAMVIKS
jgi:uncharacterized protein (TIGR01619 family)